jgi:hypothetical protein
MINLSNTCSVYDHVWFCMSIMSNMLYMFIDHYNLLVVVLVSKRDRTAILLMHSHDDSDDNHFMHSIMIVILLLICFCGVIGMFIDHVCSIVSSSINQTSKSFELGNGIVLLVGICKRKYQNNVTHCYIMNLAVTDLFYLLIAAPFTIYLDMSGPWTFSELFCRINFYLAHVRH